MLRPFKTLALSACLIAAAGSFSYAQTFTTGVAPEHVFSSSHVSDPDNVSAFSTLHVESAYGMHSIVLAGWGNSTPGHYSEVAWQYMDLNLPIVIDKGVLPYDDVAELDVSLIYDNSVSGTSVSQILVAYYRYGVGHFLDFYSITPSSTAPVLTNSMQLSTSPRYGRIRVDCFNKGLAAVVWDHPGEGIKVMAGYASGQWSAPVTLMTSTDQTEPDVAVTRAGGNSTIYLVTHNSLGTITLGNLDWNYVLAQTTPTATFLNVEDVNNVQNLNTKIVLDCPDLCMYQNWGYTYGDLENVFVRTRDHFSSASPFTVSVNSGALGNTPTVGSFKAFSPTIHYGLTEFGNSWTDHVSTGWYATNGNDKNLYAGIQMKADGLSFVNAPDYMGLPNSETTTPISSPPGIAYSKSDLEGVTNYLYAAYYDFDESMGEYRLHHAFKPWGSATFKGSKDLSRATGTYPNPFTDVIHTTVELKENGTVKLELFDINGKVVSQQSAELLAGSHEMKVQNLHNVASGVYFLNTTINGKRMAEQTVIKK